MLNVTRIWKLNSSTKHLAFKRTTNNVNKITVNIKVIRKNIYIPLFFKENNQRSNKKEIKQKPKKDVWSSWYLLEKIIREKKERLKEEIKGTRLRKGRLNH